MRQYSFSSQSISLDNNMISFTPKLENTADVFTKFLNSVQHHAFCDYLGLGRINSPMASPMRTSMRVDSASTAQLELESAAAGTKSDTHAILNNRILMLSRCTGEASPMVPRASPMKF